MPTKAHYTLYCDETGNTGSRFLLSDPDQPLFAEGGWFVDNNNYARAVAAVENLERNYTTGTNELKGAKLAKTAKGQTFIRSACEAVGKNGGVPFLYLVEKRYFVCTKIVETFFDPLFNPAISVSETWDPEKRQCDANFFSDNGGILIDEFAEAYRIKDPMAVRANAEKWAEHFERHDNPEQAARVAGVLLQIEDEIATEKQHSTSDEFPSGVDSLNLPIVADVFQFAEQQCPRTCNIIHDQTSSFEAVYNYAFSAFATAKPSAAQMKDGRQLRMGFRNVLSLSFVNSETEPLIRAADYSLAGTRKFIELATSNQKIPQDVTWAAFGTLGSLVIAIYIAAHPSLGSMPELTRVMSSNAWITKIVMRLHDEMKPLIK